MSRNNLRALTARLQAAADDWKRPAARIVDRPGRCGCGELWSAHKSVRHSGFSTLTCPTTGHVRRWSR